MNCTLKWSPKGKPLLKFSIELFQLKAFKLYATKFACVTCDSANDSGCVVYINVRGLGCKLRENIFYFCTSTNCLIIILSDYITLLLIIFRFNCAINSLICFL